MAKRRKSRKLGGMALKVEIAQSNLAVKAAELDAMKRTLAEVVNERDFLRKVVLSLSGAK